MTSPKARRQLSLAPVARARAARTERMLRALEAWAEEMAHVSLASVPGRDYDYWKIPVDSGLVAPEIASRATQTRCVRSLIRAVDAMRRPVTGSDGPWLLATIGRPDLFSSSICAFYDRDWLVSFALRDNADQRWTALPAGRSLVRELGLDLPEGFAEAGLHVWMYNEDCDPPESQSEIWAVGPREAIELLFSDVPRP